MSNLDMSAMPVRWFSYSLKNDRTKIRFAGEKHDEQSNEFLRWRCDLQTINGGLLTTGFGLSAQLAFDNAVENVNEKTDDEYYRNHVMK